jgi:hypothetical protein
MVFLTETTASLSNTWIITWFLGKIQIFHRKLAKIVENINKSDHNIAPTYPQMFLLLNYVMGWALSIAVATCSVYKIFFFSNFTYM